jgi:hypothetical protein
MKLYILFAQRVCRYPGEHAPETLAIATEFEYDENPDWLDNKLDAAKANQEFVAAAIIHINLDLAAMRAIDDRLTGTVVVQGDVVAE